MLTTVKRYVAERRKGLVKAVGFVGAVYVAAQYVRDRLEEVKDKVTQERLARERFDNSCCGR